MDGAERSGGHGIVATGGCGLGLGRVGAGLGAETIILYF